MPVAKKGSIAHLDREDVRGVINQHREALGRRRFGEATINRKFPGEKLFKEFARIEKCAEEGNDPWMNEDGDNRAAP